MKALIGINGQIIDVCEQPFPVADGLLWVDVPDETTARDVWDGEKVLLKKRESLSVNVDELWNHVNCLVSQAKVAAGLDENAHGKISMWIALGQLPQWRLDRLTQLDKWSDSAWMTYYALKERVLAGEDVELPDSLPPCPVTFARLLFEKHV
jgi:hypothetical protein